MQSYLKHGRGQKGSRLSSLRAFSLAAGLLSLPAVGAIAHAQQAPQTQPAASQTQPATQKAKAEYTVKERSGDKEPTKVILMLGKKELETYQTNGERAEKDEPFPAIRFRGPAKVTIELYPLINMKKHHEGDKLTLDYLLDDKLHKRDETIMLSNIEVKKAKMNEWRISLPLRIEFTADKGEHELIIRKPHGFIRIVKIEEITEQLPPPRTQPVIVKEKKVPDENGQLFQADAKRLEFNIGRNKGDINELDGYVTVKRLGRRLSLVAGTHLASHGVTGLSQDGTAGFRYGSFNLGPGLSLTAGGHKIVALPFAGVRLSKPSFTGTHVGGEQEAEFGGTVWYGYRDRLGLVASGSNNPANPISVSAFGALPWGWVKGSYPTLGLDARWLHLFGNSRVENDNVRISLNQNDLLARVFANIPLVRIPRIPLSIVPSAIVAVELSKSGYEGTFVGGALSLKTKCLLLELGSAVVVDQKPHRLMFFLDTRMK